jgi:hypothetical protein
MAAASTCLIYIHMCFFSFSYFPFSAPIIDSKILVLLDPGNLAILIPIIIIGD